MFLRIPSFVIPYCVASVSSVKCCTSSCSPLVLDIQTSPTTNASAFLLSPNELLTTLHALPNDCSNFNFGDRHATLLRKCEHSDLALLKLSEPEECNAPAFATFSPNTSYSVIPPVPHDPLPVVPLSVENKLVSFSGALIPLMCFEAEDPPQLNGWSGCPVVRDDTSAIVAVLVQGSGTILDTIPSVLVLHMYYSRSLSIPLARISGLYLQPLLNSAARNAFWKTSSGKLETSEEDKEEAFYKLPPRVSVIPSCTTGLHVNDLLLRLNGQDVTTDGCIEWGGLRAPIDAAVVTCAGGDSVTATVERDGVVMDVPVTVMSASTLVKGLENRCIVMSSGLVFVPLSVTVLELLRPGAKSEPLAHVSINHVLSGWKVCLEDPVSEDINNDIVIVLASTKELGWDFRSATGVAMQRVVKVDGRPIQKINDLVGPAEEEMIIELGNGFIFLLSRGKEMTMTAEMMVAMGAARREFDMP